MDDVIYEGILGNMNYLDRQLESAEFPTHDRLGKKSNERE